MSELQTLKIVPYGASTTVQVGSSTGDKLSVGSASADCDLAVTRNVTIDGTLDVDGATTLDGLTVSEAVIMSSNCEVQGNLEVDGQVKADTIQGNVQLTGPDITCNDVTINGSLVFGASATGVFILGCGEGNVTLTYQGSASSDLLVSYASDSNLGVVTGVAAQDNSGTSVDDTLRVTFSSLGTTAYHVHVNINGGSYEVTGVYKATTYADISFKRSVDSTDTDGETLYLQLTVIK